METFSEVVIELGVDIDWLIFGFELIFVVPFSASNCFNFDSFSGENPMIGDNGYLFLGGLFSLFELRLHSVVFRAKLSASLESSSSLVILALLAREGLDVLNFELTPMFNP